MQPLCFLQQKVLCTKNRLCHTDDGDTAAGILEDPRKYSALVVVVRGPTAPQRCACKPSCVACIVSLHALCLTTKLVPLWQVLICHMLCHALLRRSLYLRRSSAASDSCLPVPYKAAVWHHLSLLSSLGQFPVELPARIHTSNYNSIVVLAAGAMSQQGSRSLSWSLGASLGASRPWQMWCQCRRSTRARRCWKLHCHGRSSL